MSPYHTYHYLIILRRKPPRVSAHNNRNPTVSSSETDGTCDVCLPTILKVFDFITLSRKGSPQQEPEKTTSTSAKGVEFVKGSTKGWQDVTAMVKAFCWLKLFEIVSEGNQKDVCFTGYLFVIVQTRVYPYGIVCRILFASLSLCVHFGLFSF